MALEDYLRRRLELNGGDELGDGPPVLAAPRPINPYLRRPSFTTATATAASAPRERQSLALSAWKTVTSPLRAAAGATGSLGGQLGRLFDPEGYEQASREIRESITGGEDRELGPLESAEALPGLGDVVATNISKEGISGRLLRPVTTLALNLLADPTSYVGVGILPKLTQVGRATSAVAKAQRGLKLAEEAGDAARAAELAQQIPTLAGELAKASRGESALGRAARSLEGLGERGATGTALRTAARAPDLTSALRGAGRVGATLPFSPIVGASYAPELVESIGAGVQQTVEDVRAGRLAEAAASGVGALLTTALGRMVAKGLIDEGRAAGVLERTLGEQLSKQAGGGADVPQADTGVQAAPELSMPAVPGAVRSAQAVQPTRPSEVMAEADERAPTPDMTPPVPATPPLPTGPPTGPPAPGVPPTSLVARQEGGPAEPVGAVAPSPIPAPAPVPAPVPGSDRIKVDRTPDKLKSLQDLFEERTAGGQALTKRDLVERGLVTANQAKTYSVEALVDALGGTELKGRLEHRPGAGFIVKAAKAAQATESATSRAESREEVGVEAGQPAVDVSRADQHTPTPAPIDEVVAPASAPAPAAPPAKTPRSEIDRQLAETPGLLSRSQDALADLAQRRGKTLDELGPQDVREEFPGDGQKPVRALLIRVLEGGKKARRMAVEEAAKAGGGAAAPARAAEAVAATGDAKPAAATSLAVDRGTSTGDERTPAAASESIESTIPPGERVWKWDPEAGRPYLETKAPQQPEPVTFPPREGPQSVAENLVVPKRADEPHTTDRPGRAWFGDSGIFTRTTERAAERVTAPGMAAPTRVVAPSEPGQVVGLRRGYEGSALDTPGEEIAAHRLLGDPTALHKSGGYDPASPAGKVQETYRRRGYDEDTLQNRILRMLDVVDRDPADLSPTESKLRNLLVDAPDEAAARAELTKLLFKGTKQDRLAVIGAKNRQAAVLERELDLSEGAAVGLDKAQQQRMAIHKPAGIDAVDRADPDPDYPTRPDGVDTADWRAQVAADPALLDGYASAVAWARNDWGIGPVHTGTKAQQSPYMRVLSGIADDLGIIPKKNAGADWMIKRIAKHLAELRGEKPPDAAVTDLLTDQLVAQRGAVWQKKIQQAPKIGGSDARVVDFEGDAGDLTPALAGASTRVADVLSRATADISAAVQLSTRFGGLTPSPQLSGVRVDDALYLNPVEAFHRAKAQGLEGDALTYKTAESLTDTLLHELAHRKARHDAATGDESFIAAYARAVEDSSGLYSETIREVQNAVVPMLKDLEAMAPAYARAQEVVRARVQGAGSRPGRGGAAADADRYRGGPGGAPRDGGAGVLAVSPVPRGSEETGRGVGAGAAARAGAPAGDVGAGAGRAADAGREPAASLTPLVPQALRDRQTKATLERVARLYADTIKKYTAGGESADEILDRIAAVDRLPEAERQKLITAGPQKQWDIGLNLNKFASDAMSDSQKAELALLLKLRNSTQPRSTPMHWDQVDAEMREILDVHTPEEFTKLKEKSGLKDPRDFAFMRASVATFGRAMDEARALLRAAEIRGDEDAAQKAMDRLAWASNQRLAAINVLVPNTTNVARILAFQRIMMHPLGPEETFRSRFYGAMRASKIPNEKAEQLYQMFAGTAKAGAAGDWSRFASAFREATKAKAFDKFLEFWKAGLLGFPTQIANLGSNAAFLALRNIENGISSLTAKYITGDTKRAGEIAGRALGLRHAMDDVFPILKDDLTNIAKLEPPDIGARLERGSFQDDPNLRQLYGAIGGKAGEFVRISFKLLDASDNLFKHIARMQEYGAQAAKLAHDPENWSHPTEGRQHAVGRILNELRMIAKDPISHQSLYNKKNKKNVYVYKDAIEAGRRAMLEDTFQKPLGDTMRKLHHATQAHPALQLLFPFVKTPYNILAEGMKRTPMGAIWAGKEYAAGRIDKPEFVQAMVKSAIGTTVMGLVADLALDGTVTGGGPTDPKQAELLKRTGWQPYSIKVGDEYFSYQRAEPFATVLGIAADMAEAWKRKDLDTANELMEKAVASASDNVFNKTFLTGLESLVKIATNAGGGRAAAIRQLQASLVPNVVGVIPVAHTARALDPNYRETEAFTLSPFLAQIPGASLHLPPQYGPSGEKRERRGSPLERLLSPIQRSEIKTDPAAVAAAEIVRLGKSIEKPPLYLRVGQDKIYYTVEERAALAQAQEKAVQKIAGVISRPGYSSLPDSESVSGPKRKTKADVVQEVKNRVLSPVKRRIDREALLRAQREEKR